LTIILAVSAVGFLFAAWFKIRSYPSAFALAAIIWLSLAGATVFLIISLTHQPYILVATLEGFERRGRDAIYEGKLSGTYVQLNVTESFYLTDVGRGEALPEKVGALELVTNTAVYGALSNHSIGDEVLILALGRNEAIGVVTSDHRLIMSNGTHDLVR